MAIHGLDAGFPSADASEWPSGDGLFNLSLQVPAFATAILASGDTWRGNLDLRALARGVYCLRVMSGGTQEVRRLVVE